MTDHSNENESFISSQLVFVDNENNQKTLCIPIKNQKSRQRHDYISKSWSGNFQCERPNHEPKNFSVSPTNQLFCNMYGSSKPYNAMANCKSAGIIPYTIRNGQVLFLFQQAINPIRKKDSGWNDFGGKKVNHLEETAETAAREFSEETSCLFYLKEQQDIKNFKTYYDILKDNETMEYDSNATTILKNLIPMSQKYYSDKITEFVLPIYISSKETYISYFVKVDYIPEKDLPRAEDIHIPYDTRYLRMCKWFSMEEIMNLDRRDFHKRLQITRIQQRIQNYHEKELFS